MPYATPAEMELFYDVADLKDLCSDSGTPADSLTANPILLKLLLVGSGQVDAALSMGKMYTPAQLAALTGNSLALLQRITCQVAWAHLCYRRLNQDPERYDKALEVSQKWLSRLQKGENVFAIDVNIEAGLPTTDGPTVTDYDRLNLLPDRVKNFYPSRASRLPTNRLN